MEVERCNPLTQSLGTQQRMEGAPSGGDEGWYPGSLRRFRLRNLPGLAGQDLPSVLAETMQLSLLLIRHLAQIHFTTARPRSATVPFATVDWVFCSDLLCLS